MRISWMLEMNSLRQTNMEHLYLYYDISILYNTNILYKQKQ